MAQTRIGLGVAKTPDRRQLSRSPSTSLLELPRVSFLVLHQFHFALRFELSACSGQRNLSLASVRCPGSRSCQHDNPFRYSSTPLTPEHTPQPPR